MPLEWGCWPCENSSVAFPHRRIAYAFKIKTKILAVTRGECRNHKLPNDLSFPLLQQWVVVRTLHLTSVCEEDLKSSLEKAVSMLPPPLRRSC